MDVTGRTGTTEEAAVGEGAMVQKSTPPPTKMDRKLGAAVRTDVKEVGRRRQDDGLMGMVTSVCPAVRLPQEKLGPAIGRPQRGQYIESEGGYLREASRQAPTGEGAASRQAPTDKRETSVVPAIWSPQ